MATHTRFIFYNDDGEVQYSCKVKCYRCKYKKQDDTQCKNRSCFYLPFCWLHVKKEYGLVVKQSQIPNIGRGLFADRDIPRNTWIAPLFGIERTWQEINNRYGSGYTKPYAVGTGGVVYDAACQRFVGHFANSAKGFPQHRNNARIERRQNHRYSVWLRSSRQSIIHKGDEIFLNYGGTYKLAEVYEYKRTRKNLPDEQF